MMMYPQAPWAMPAPPAPAPSEEGPAPRAPRGVAPNRYALIVAIVIVTITVAAMVLAVIGPALASSGPSPIPSGWARVYDASLTNDGSWDAGADCSYATNGLDVRGGANVRNACVFGRSEGNDLTSAGVYVQASVVPAASVPGNQVPAIALVFNDSRAFFAVNQEGQYELCLPGDGSLCPTGATVAWHEDGFVANTLALRYANGILTGYANGQVVAERPADLSSKATIVLSATRGDEALFTHATIYSGSGI
jgi:hypothetical protein